jgi:hypothetical protein
LIEVVLEALRVEALTVPAASDGETSYTKRLLIPLVDSVLAGLEFPGLARRGSEAGQLRSAHLLGHPFYPDIMIDWRSEPILAIEVKFLRVAQRQNAIATAVGQSLIYLRRYPSSFVMLLDSRAATSHDEIRDAAAWIGSWPATQLIFRQRSLLAPSMLAPHPEQIVRE